jgi:putative hemolysin
MLSALVRQWPLVPGPTQKVARLVRAALEFPRKVEVDFTVRNFRVKTVATEAELRGVLALRKRVFHLEFAGKRVSLRSDKDPLDDVADHLAIFDTTAPAGPFGSSTGKAIGVYRLIAGAGPFYSDSEFDIAPLLALPGRKLELSRACIDRAHRNGVVIALLWKGLAEYAKADGTDLLFGMASLPTMDVAKIAAMHAHLVAEGRVDAALAPAPRAAYAIPGFAAALAAADAASGERLVPPLLAAYFKAGAKICSQPVIDRAFNCADWLTALDMRQLASAYGRRFMRSDAKSPV